LKLGIVSDVHCNIVGLKRAVELMGDIDELLCLGDSIYEYRFSNEVIRYLREVGAQVILGNHEEASCRRPACARGKRHGSTGNSWIGSPGSRIGAT
jgi:predicted phosphodiesterase